MITRDARLCGSDGTLYFLELVWTIYKAAADIELCTPRHVRQYNLQHPTVKSLIRQRVGSINRLRLGEPVVAPSDIANSKLLKIIPTP